MFHNKSGFFLRQASVLKDVFDELLLAKFCYKVKVVFVFEKLIQFNDIGVI